MDLHFYQQDDLSLAKDSGFLLRCALTHNWNSLIDVCCIIQETFTTCKRLRGIHLLRGAKARRLLAASDEWGNNVLQAACYHRPPVRVVEAVLNAMEACRQYYNKHDDDDDHESSSINKDDSRQPSTMPFLHLKRARDGSTALQVACACGASVDVIRTLLEAPHVASLVAVSDTTGSTALSDLVVQYILERKSPQHRGSLPLNEIHLIEEATSSPIFETFWTKVELLLRAAWFADFQSEGQEGSTLSTPFLSFESTAAAAAKAASRNLRGSSYISVVHGLAHVAEAVPTEITEMICRCFSHMLSFSDPDGVLPIHICISNEGRYNHQENTMHPKARERRNFVIQKLLQAYPDAASQPMPISTQQQQPQQSLLACAIQSELYWHMDDGSEGPVQTLWKLAPSKLGEVDRQTTVLPFMMAAASATSSSSSTCNTGTDRKSLSQVCNLLSQGQMIENDEQAKEQDLRALDTIYCLIRMDPLVLLNVV